jgi:LacI family transcriptional regulator
MNATVRDVAKRAGVSAMTVSRVINGSTGVRPETRRRVERAVSELDFVPNGVARGLTSKRSGTLGLIVPDIVNPFFSIVVRGAETVARRAGYRLLLCNSEGDLGLERQYVEDLISHRAEGIIIAPVGDRSKANLLPVVRRKFPFVLIDRSVAGLPCDLVQADSAAGARALIAHLLSIGHRRIGAIVEADNVSTARDRLQGYNDALASAGIKPTPELVIRTTADRAGGYGAMQQFLGFEERPTAVFAVNNMTAVGAMQAVRERGLVVPRDIALVCFDDVEHLAVLSPFLTVINQPTEMFGTLAAEILIHRINGEGAGPRRHVVLQSELIVRESCGAKAGPLPSLEKTSQRTPVPPNNPNHKPNPKAS